MLDIILIVVLILNLCQAIYWHFMENEVYENEVEGCYWEDYDRYHNKSMFCLMLCLLCLVGLAI